jgi:saccharopine dehydrogenase-like NADP-dependent oxidoreductase
VTLDRIAVLGLGRVGGLAARLLHEAGLSVTGFDRVRPPGEIPFEVRDLDAADAAALAADLGGVDAVLSCLPYHCNRRWPSSPTPSACTTSTSPRTSHHQAIMELADDRHRP